MGEMSSLSTGAPAARSMADCTSLQSRSPLQSVPRLALVLGLTLGFMVIEAVGGWLSGSLALLADAGHMLTDAGALALSVLSAWIAQRPANDSKTYGYHRWEILAALINGAALFGIAAWVVVEAVQRHPASGTDSGRSLPHRGRRGAWWSTSSAWQFPRLAAREASTPGAPTSTSWATRSARSAR